jgi:predicted MFS family arabinose efflux permease
MSDVPARLEAGQLEPDEPAEYPAGRYLGAKYVAVLRTPGAARFCVSAMIGRAPMSMFGLGTVLLVAASTGRYAVAGLVSGAGSIGYAVCAPQLARLADKFGQHRVLRPLIAFFASSCVVFVLCAELKAPLWLLMITGCLAGSSMPSLGSMVRARWSALLSDPAALQSAFALESVVDEMVFVIGPALVTVLATALPPAGILLCMVLAVTGTLFFAAQRQTEPAVRPPEPRQRSGASEADTAINGGRRLLRRLPAPGLLTMAPLYLCLGAMFASIDLSTVDFAQRHGHKPLAGLILGTYAFGSGVGGLWYGSRTWRARLERRFALTLALTVAGVATFWTQPSLLSLDGGVLIAGLTIAPTLIAGYALIERQTRGARQTEAMTWLSSAISIGVAVGSAICGRIIDTVGPRWGYGFAATCGAIAISICLLGLRRLHATAGAKAAQWANA